MKNKFLTPAVTLSLLAIPLAADAAKLLSLTSNVTTQKHGYSQLSMLRTDADFLLEKAPA